MTANTTTIRMRRRRVRPWVRCIKWLLWTAMAIVLFCYGSLVCVEHLLTPERLTPLAEYAANEMLEADVSIGRIELSMRHSLPFLNIDIDSLSIVSRQMHHLTPEQRSATPQWCDTLLSVDHIHGGISLAHLAFNHIKLNDIEIDGPAINIAVVAEDVNNFNIFPTSTEPESDEPLSLPKITLSRFAFVNPKPIRYLDVASGDYANIVLHQVQLTGTEAPRYNLSLVSNIYSPLLQYLAMEEMPVSFDGTLVWNQDNIYDIGLDELRFKVSILEGVLSTNLDFENNLIVKSFDLDMAPIDVTRLLAMIPAEHFAGTGFDPKQLSTDAQVALAIHLEQPYEVDKATVPYAKIFMGLPDCRLDWEAVHLSRLGTDVEVALNGPNADDIVVDISRFDAHGDGTDLTAHGTVTRLMSDPTADFYLNGKVVLQHLPKQVLRYAEGYLSGRLTANAHIRGSESMLDVANFHKLKVNGDISLDDLYYVHCDSVNMVFMNHGKFEFDTNKSIKQGEHKVDSLLTATVEVDSASILHSDIAMTVNNFSLNLGALNTSSSSDTTMVIPIGGGLKMDRFNLTLLKDSTVARIRGAEGRLTMKRYKGSTHLPEFILNATVNRMSAGTPDVRFMVSGASITLNTNKKEERQMTREVKAIYDSVALAQPDIPADEIYAVAMRIYRQHRHTRITMAKPGDSTEYIDWDTSKQVREILKDWAFTGSMKAERAALYSPFFPLRNRMRNLNVSFCNDSVTFTNVAYKAGHSDFLLSGRISNIQRALTSKKFRSPLRAHFEIISDTIDVNELASAFFSGSTYAEGRTRINMSDDAEEEHIEKMFDAHTIAPQDTMAPILVPTNINAEILVRAAHVLYADMSFNNVRGRVLACEGAVNFNNIHGASDFGSVDMSAMYQAPRVDDISFGLGLKVDRFNVRNFMKLIPSLDTIMPIMRDFSGILSADMAVTTDIDSHMNIVLPSLRAAVNLSGDSLVVMDEKTFSSVAKWLLFRDKKHNMIDHMDVQLVVEDNRLEIFPFMFYLDRYKLGVSGYNDLDMNFDYHIAVLKSPLPFKFGINIKGNPEKYKVRLGRARFNEQQSVSRREFVDTTRINLVNRIEGVFRRGVSLSRFAPLTINSRPTLAEDINLDTDTISRADSLLFIKEGLIPAPPVDSTAIAEQQNTNKKKKNKKKK